MRHADTGTESRDRVMQNAGRPEKKNGKGGGDNQDHEGIPLALIANHADRAQNEGHRRAKQYEGFYKNPEWTASAWGAEGAPRVWRFPRFQTPSRPSCRIASTVLSTKPAPHANPFHNHIKRRNPPTMIATSTASHLRRSCAIPSAPRARPAGRRSRSGALQGLETGSCQVEPEWCDEGRTPIGLAVAIYRISQLSCRISWLFQKAGITHAAGDADLVEVVQQRNRVLAAGVEEVLELDAFQAAVLLDVGDQTLLRGRHRLRVEQQVLIDPNQLLLLRKNSQSPAAPAAGRPASDRQSPAGRAGRRDDFGTASPRSGAVAARRC